MPEVDPVILELRAELRQYQNRVVATTNIVDRSLRQNEQRVQSLERQFQRTGGAISGSLRLITGALAGVSALALVRELVSLADAAKQVDAQLNLATTESGNFGKAQADVARIARETRAGLQEVATLYSVLQRNALQLGITQEEAARSTETISKSFLISGATAAEAAGGMRQFIQGLQSGTLRGEEFNSVVENAPRLAKLLADQLSNGNIGALRALAEAGKITGAELTAALTNPEFTAKIDAEFKQLPVTFDQSMTLVKNAAIETFGAFDRGGQFSNALATFVSDGSEGFADLSRDAEALGADIRATFEALRDVFDPFVSAAQNAFEIIGLDSRNISSQIRDDVRSILGAYDGINAFGANLLGTARTNALEKFDRSAASGRAGANESRFNARAGGNGFQRFLNEPDKYDILGNRIGGNSRPAAAVGKPQKKKTGGKSAEQIERDAQRAAEKLADDALRFAEDLRRLRAEQLQNELGVTTDAEKRFEIQSDLTEIELQSRLEAIKADRDLTDARKAQLIEQTNRIYGRNSAGDILPGQNFIATERLRELDEQFARLAQQELKDKAQTLATDADLASNRLERLAIERRILALQQQEERDALDAAIKRGEITDAVAARANLERRQANASEGLNRTFEGPGARYQRQIADVGNNINDSLEQVQVDGLDALNQGLVDAITGAESLGDVFKKVSQQIITDMLRIALQQAIIKPLAGALFGADGASGGGGQSGLFGSLIGSLLPGRMSGGYMPPNSVRRVNEGRGGVELLRVGPEGGTVIPLGQANTVAQRAPTSGTIVVEVQASPYFDGRVAQVSSSIAQDVSVKVVRASAPSIARAGADMAYKDAQHYNRFSTRKN